MTMTMTVPLLPTLYRENWSTTQLHDVQSSAIIMRCNITLFCLWYDNDWGKICIRVFIHKRHPKFRPYGRALGCLCKALGENWPRYNGSALYHKWPIINDAKYQENKTLTKEQKWSVTKTGKKHQKRRSHPCHATRCQWPLTCGDRVIPV